MKKQNNLPCVAIVLGFIDDTQGRTVGACSEKGLGFTFPLPISIFQMVFW